MSNRNQHAPRPTGPTEKSLRDRFEQQIGLRARPAQPKPSRTKVLGQDIFYVGKLWGKIGLFLLVLFLILLGLSIGYILIERWQIRSQRNAQVESIIGAYINNYLMDEYRASEYRPSKPSGNPSDRDTVMNWFSHRLAELNKGRGTKVSTNSSFVEKAQAAEEIVGRNLKLTDGADWDNGENTRFSTSRQVIKKGGGDETDLALMKVTFLRYMGVSGDNAYVVLYIDSTEADMRGVAVVKLPDGKEMYLDKTKSTRAPGGKAYQELVEFGVGHPTKKRPN